MKLSLSIVLLSLPVGCQAYLPSLSHSRTTRAAFAAPSTSQVDSSQSNSDAAFSAFADTLDEESPLDRTVSKNPSQQQQGNMDNNSKNNKPWQAKLEDLLDPKTNLAERQILLSELLDSNDQIRESVMDALANRKIDPLLTPTAAKLQDGTRAVVRQIANDILPQLSKSANRQRSGSANNNNNNSNSPLPSLPMMPFAPPSPASLEKMAGRVLDLMSNQLQTTAKEFQEDLTDPLNKIPQRLTKQTGDLVKEARNIFLETPEGLAEPPYQVVESCDLYEVRDYEGYTVASTATAMTKGDTGIEDMATAGTSFNALAAYLFGENADNKAMAMTTPVTTTNLGEMRFYLAEPQIPLPLNNNNNNGGVAGESTAPMEGDNAATSSVKIVDVPAARLAVRKFTGFATDGEVARQKDTLLQALAMDGIELDVDHGAVVPYVVFQYNPPYTLPMVRRNEVAVPVRSPEAIATKSSLKEEWSVDDNIIEDEEDVSSSDV